MSSSDAQRHLDRAHRRELERLVELRAVDVRETDGAHEPLLGEPRERANRGTPRRPRVGRVDEVEVDREPVQRLEARLAVRADRLGTAVRDPCAGRTRHPALRHDPRARLGAAATERTGQQPLVVTELGRVPRVGVGGVEHGDARRGGRCDRLDRQLLVPLVGRREAHAAEADAELRVVEPGRSGQATEATRRRSSPSPSPGIAALHEDFVFKEHKRCPTWWRGSSLCYFNTSAFARSFLVQIPYGGMEGSALNRLAFSATAHCLTGCAIGEVLGVVIGTALGWGNAPTIALAIVLAFLFGYSLTMIPLLRAGLALTAAIPLALASDTFSIAVMELVDNGVLLLVPGAMEAGLAEPLFWGSLAFALAVAFVAAFPVNRWLIARGKGHAVVHAHHGHG